MMFRTSLLGACLIAVSVFSPLPGSAFFSDADIGVMQRTIEFRTVGDRISFWAEQFVGTPYDTDVLGEYVRKRVIVSDERVDCMYLTFRSVELALGKDPADAVRIALDKRFIQQGRTKNGRVVNYEERFQYAEDMIESGKWGREITPELGDTELIKGSRGRGHVIIVSRENARRKVDRLRNGDIIFFVPQPGRRVSGENISHIGIIVKEGEQVYMVHASGMKQRGGMVKKVLFQDYISSRPFIGIKVSRFGME